MRERINTTLPASGVEDIDPAVLEAIDNYADEAGYGYDRYPVDEARQGCGMEGSKWFRIPAGSSFSMRHYGGKPRNSTVNEGAFIEVVDMDGEGYKPESFLRIYSVVDGDVGYSLSDT